jgi:ATP-dependent RNA helicase HrpA
MATPSGPGRPVPDITYPEELPIANRREEIAAAIAANQVVIVAGETGSGKTTQLPKICLQLGRGLEKRIAHTQPRRLAARNVAARIASELGGSVGELVGFQVRFNDQVSEGTAVKLMTDGILLNEMQNDRLLRQYDTIIIDEAHERSLNIDFLLGYLKGILPKRPDLKVIVTSATIDVESFSKHFSDAPVIEVSGRTYPVETIYFAPGEEESSEDEDTARSIRYRVEEIARGDYGTAGDILAFLPGEREIREVARELKGLDSVEVLPLYARLGQAEQNRIFQTSRRGKGVRVVLATNVAETSITVPGIRYVIDPGKARVSRYSHRSKLQRLPIESISQASADQRKGRCGRVAAGVCLRLYSEEDFTSRAEFTEPEIQRTNLAAVVLQMLSLDLGEIGEFPFIDPPDQRLVRDGYKVLEEIGAVTPSGRLTKVGRKLARIPVDPRLGRMLLAATREGCLDEVLVIVSALSIQDPRERPTEKQQQADQSHARFKHERSDFIAWLSLWQYYEEQRQSLSQNRLRKLCKKEFLSYTRMREWREVHTQLRIACKQQKMAVRADLPEEENYRGIHRALLSGLLANIAQHQEGREYLGARNRKMMIFPGSSQSRRKPAWIVAAEVVETSQVFARQVAGIDPRWAADINPGLIKKHHSDPHWRARSGQVLAQERLSLYGLTLSDKNQVHYGQIDPVHSRELMISEGLVPGNFHRFPKFLKHNRRLVRDLEELEVRTRRRDILVEDRALFAFYDERLPPDIYTSRHLDSWLKDNPGLEKSLYMHREDLLSRDPGLGLEEQFPPHIEWQGNRFKLSYEFNPGTLEDGVSVSIPVALLNRAPRFLFDWLVPGMLREKCIVLVKALPKDKRKHLVPVPDFVDRALSELQADDVDLLESLAVTLSRLSGISLGLADWNVDKLDDYYRMNIRVVDAEGKRLGQGRNLAQLVKQFGEDTRASIHQGKEESPAQSGMTRWDFGDVAQEWRFRQAGVEIVSWPGLSDCGDSVAIELFDYPYQARAHHQPGVIKLARLASADQVRYIRKQALKGNESQLAVAAAGFQRDALLEDMIDAVFQQALKLEEGLPFRQEDFQKRLSAGKSEVVGIAADLEKSLRSALKELGAAQQWLARYESGQFQDSRSDIKKQLEWAFAPAFQRDTPARWLSQYPRYMKALAVRAEKLSGQYVKDQKSMGLVHPLAEKLEEALASRPQLLLYCEPAQEYRWMLEEFRVSLFAQNLGTRKAVSKKRLEEQWLAVEEWLRKNPL